MEAYQDQQQDILNDLGLNLVQASGGKRFANYIIDVIVFYIFIFIVAFFWAYFNPDSINRYTDSSSGDSFTDRLLYLCYYAIYMFFIELIFKGKSIGKFVTGTKAVNEDGSTISPKTAFLRGISRAVPFEGFTALGDPSYPWHDKWTKTYVIDEKKSHIV
jgi:uncharacterized RDD family membrane protein YckC